jgi:nitroimidazol reductase NimA-like FMN-containing flavoprotein (pyridoxamine 5'-phosphate oxidase superfamily)
MRRKEKEIHDLGEIERIIRLGTVCRVAFACDNIPYIVPMYYGYQDGCLFFHAALKGKKIDMLKYNNRVCFEIDIQSEIINTGVPCNWKSSYKSVIGFGKASLVEDIEGKKKALNVLINHYAPDEQYKFPLKNVKRTAVIKIKILEMTGKKSE